MPKLNNDSQITILQQIARLGVVQSLDRVYTTNQIFASIIIMKGMRCRRFVEPFKSYRCVFISKLNVRAQKFRKVGYGAVAQYQTTMNHQDTENIKTNKATKPIIFSKVLNPWYISRTRTLKRRKLSCRSNKRIRGQNMH